MHRALRWIRNVVVSLVVLLLIIVATVYALSERIIRRTYDEPLVPVAVPTDSASITEGGRLALVHGCRGCHMKDLSGQWFEDDFLIGRLAAPNLTEAAQKYSDAELVRLIRHGVRPDGKSVLAMPSEMFTPLTDADLGAIIAYIRSVAAVPGLSRTVQLGPMARFGLVTGQYEPSAVWVHKVDSVTASGYYPVADQPNALGAYLARTSCTECHGLTLNGDFGPNLRIAAGYTREQFAHFFATGEAQGGRELPLMSVMARNRFSHFTDEEESALYAYLVARASAQDQPAP
jgi:mono/diheme cytochrome c family protein